MDGEPGGTMVLLYHRLENIHMAWLIVLNNIHTMYLLFPSLMYATIFIRCVVVDLVEIIFSLSPSPSPVLVSFHFVKFFYLQVVKIDNG